MKSEVQPPKPEAERLAFVALGSNLGDSKRRVSEAMERLREFSGSPLLESSLWRSAPMDCPPGSPDFVTAVVGLEPRAGETPESLLAQLRTLELAFGRAPRKVRNEPRPLDLDLITFRDERRSTALLTLPHPRAHLRPFVLQPLAEIAPGLLLPGQTETVSELLSGLGTRDRPTRLAG